MSRPSKIRAQRKGIGGNGPFARRDRIIRQELASLPSEALVIDIGSGVLRRLDLAETQRYFSTDIRALPNVDFVADATALSLASDCADAVLVLEVLEHVPRPGELLEEVRRVLKPGGIVMVSVPSTVPRHDENDYWRFTAQGLSQLCSGLFTEGEVHVLGGTFEALAYVIGYYIALGAHPLRIPVRRLRDALMSIGHWLDCHNNWSSSTSGLHTLAFDVFFVGKARSDGDAA